MGDCFRFDDGRGVNRSSTALFIMVIRDLDGPRKLVSFDFGSQIEGMVYDEKSGCIGFQGKGTNGKYQISSRTNQNANETRGKWRIHDLDSLESLCNFLEVLPQDHLRNQVSEGN